MRGHTGAVLLLMICTIGLAYAAAEGGDASIATRLAGGFLTIALGLLLLVQMRGRTSTQKRRALVAVAEPETMPRRGKRRADDASVAEDDLARCSIEVCEELSEVEQAKVLLSFGRTQEAARALAAISAHPADGVDGLIRQSALSGDPTASAEEETSFNVDADTRGDAEPRSLEDYPHILNEVVSKWGRPECAVYLDCLLLDTRKGSRKGFPITVAEEVILLRRLLQKRAA